uniref:Uncharacterized protein n=1 Tax=Rhizophora mucronata TaxID=61149 RepID=A0A2P2N2R2_RHIMU
MYNGMKPMQNEKIVFVNWSTFLVLNPQLICTFSFYSVIIHEYAKKFTSFPSKYNLRSFFYYLSILKRAL